jgi:catechol 2,3-dioxygenase-like lactoylglutathione lyase family enzyme
LERLWILAGLTKMHRGMCAITLVMARLAYACVLTRDIERLAAFYREVLQADPEWTGPYAEFPTGGGIFSLWSVKAYADIAGTAAVPNFGSAPVMLEFEIDDVDAEYRRLQHLAAFNIEFIIPPTTMAWGNRSIYFRDPEGNLLNLFSRQSK